ncbi:hypothetical protein FRC06_010358, partial [Ceratobasidium sp. 370]
YIHEVSTPEYLHIVYVKRGWAASNKREATQQIITYCQRLEALRIHQAHLDEFYGPQVRRGKSTKTAVFIDDDEDIEYQPEDGENGMGWSSGDAEAEANEEGWEDEEDLEDDNDQEGERRQGTALDGDNVEHPAPEFAISIRPTRRVTLPKLVNVYGATSLERALRGFLRRHTHGRGRYSILPHEFFDVWHKLTLYHPPLSFAPDEPSQCDVIRVRPLIYDERRRLRTRFEPVSTRPCLFTTATSSVSIVRLSFFVFFSLHNPAYFSLLAGYRAGRVCAIFRLPERLRYLYDGELVYLEHFAPFDTQASPVHHLHTTSHARTGNSRQSIVVPIEDVVLACHLTPQFRYIYADARLDLRTDLLNNTRRFFFNHYYNNYTFLLTHCWRHHTEVPAAP